MRRFFDGCIHWLMLEFDVSKGAVRSAFYLVGAIGWVAHGALCLCRSPEPEWFGCVCALICAALVAFNRFSDRHYDDAAGANWSQADTPYNAAYHLRCALFVGAFFLVYDCSIAFFSDQPFYVALSITDAQIALSSALLWAICGTPPKPPPKRAKRLVTCEA